MSVVLSDHLPLLASAPDGIQKLRGLILELAVRGKLVPQDPNDEPTSELLKRIAKERERLEAGGKIKKSKPLPPVGENERPFDVPKGWRWVRLAESLAVVTDGDHLPPPKANSGVPFLVIGNLNAGQITFDGCRFVPQSYFDELDWSRRPTAGDLLYTVTGSFGIAIPVTTDAPFCVQRHVAILKSVGNSPTAYLLHYLQSPPSKSFAEAVATGIAQKTVTLGSLRQMPIALPPLAEQHRIVTKVDELMALCDQLEAEVGVGETAHAKLVETLLGTLTQSANAADLAANWQRLAEHFNTLFTTESSLDALKQTVLQLATSGMLASKAERHDWQKGTLADVVARSEAGWSPQCESAARKGNEWGVLKVSAVSWNDFDPTQNKALPSHLSPRPEIEVQTGDFLISRANTAELVAKSVVVKTTPQHLMLSDKTIRLHFTEDADPRFFCLANNAPVARDYYAQIAGGTSSSMKNVSRPQILGLPVLIPPLPEQHRIVAKVDELMALCNRLKADLAEARSRQARLSATLIESALQAA